MVPPRLIGPPTWEIQSLSGKSVPFYGLSGRDPRGFGILIVLKYGSKICAHFNDNLNVPGLRILTFSREDIPGQAAKSLNKYTQATTNSLLNNHPALAFGGEGHFLRSMLAEVVTDNMGVPLDFKVMKWLDEAV